MKHNWEYKPFKSVANVLYGFPFESSLFNTDSIGVPLIRIRDVKPGYTSTYYKGTFSDEYLIHKGDYLVGMDGEFNIAPWKSENALLNQRVCRVKSYKENIVLTDYLFYFLSKELKKIEDQTSFVTVKHLSAKVINDINTPIPPMEVQEQIVAELDKLNEIIADCRELIRTLDSLAESLFYDYFGDLVTNSKSWEIKKLSDCCIQIYAGGDKPLDTTLQKTAINQIPIFSNGVTNEGLYGYTSIPRTIEPAITLSGRGTIGIPFIRKSPFFPIIRLIVVIPRLNILNLHFLYHLFLLMNLGGKGAAIPQLTVPMVKEICLPVPPLNLQNEFAERIERIEEQKKAVEETISTLQILLDSRMDYWFN